MKSGTSNVFEAVFCFTATPVDIFARCIFIDFLFFSLFPYFFKHFYLIFFFLLFVCLFVSRPMSGIHNMCPVFLCVFRQPSPSLHDKYACITNISFSRFLKSEAFWKLTFIFLAVCKSWAAWFCFAYTTSIQGSVDLWFVVRGHHDINRDISRSWISVSYLTESLGYKQWQ